MGQAVTIPREECVCIAEIASLMNDTYTVVRTSGEQDAGWVIPATHHRCAAISPEWVGAHASLHAAKNPGTWRIHMHNGHENPSIHSCGWRRLETIAPTRLRGNEAAITAWREETKAILDAAEKKRVLPPKETPHQHSS